MSIVIGSHYRKNTLFCNNYHQKSTTPELLLISGIIVRRLDNNLLSNLSAVLSTVQQRQKIRRTACAESHNETQHAVQLQIIDFQASVFCLCFCIQPQLQFLQLLLTICGPFSPFFLQKQYDGSSDGKQRSTPKIQLIYYEAIINLTRGFSRCLKGQKEHYCFSNF